MVLDVSLVRLVVVFFVPLGGRSVISGLRAGRRCCGVPLGGLEVVVDRFDKGLDGVVYIFGYPARFLFLYPR